MGCFTDVVELEHAADDVIAALEGAWRICQRVEFRRGLGQTGDHRGLRQVEFGHRLAVVHARRRPDPVRAVTQVDLVEIELEDLFLGEFSFYSKGKEYLAELARVGLFAAEIEIACHLHGDGAAALLLLSGERELYAGPQQAAVVHARVLKEVCVLGRQECLDHVFRDLLVGQRIAPLFTKLRDQPAVLAEHLQRHLQPHFAEVVDIGQVGLEIVIGGRQAAAPGRRRGCPGSSRT